jgi:16S rRNA C967 or C1407 C5-methylase (RsmB/RsmF family)/NOL1/NOP2/fmu family ribosome biogenesis protein
MKNLLPEAFVESVNASAWMNSALLIPALDADAPVTVRLHPRKKNLWPRERPVLWCRDGFYLDERPIFTLDPLLHAGGYYVQEASSMFLEVVFQSLQLSEPCVLDVCAAPGGKSTHLATLLGDSGLLVSNEVIRSRCSALLENLGKWGMGNGVVTHNDPADFQQLPGFFDVVLVDAPCSGEGMFRKDVDARAQWSPEHVTHCALRQKRILEDIWPCIKEGGYLVYSTCTFNETENEKQLVALREHHQFDSLRIPLREAWNVVETEMNGIFGYRFFPGQVQGEGFFISVLKKTEWAPSLLLRKSSKTKNTIFGAFRQSRMPWLTDSFPCEWLTFRDQVLALPARWVDEIEAIASRLTVLQAGTPLGAIKNNKIAPAHELALSVHLAGEVPRLAVNHEQALRYLRKEALDDMAANKGFYLVTYQQQPLGWINHLGNRINNLYPADWRIRMRN